MDNDELLAENAVPSLSSIEPDFNEAGYRAALEMDRLLRARKNTAGHKLVCGVKRLVERHSTVYLTPSAQLLFRKETGLTPREWRRQKGTSLPARLQGAK